MDTKNRLQKTPRALACFGWKGGEGREGSGCRTDVFSSFSLASAIKSAKIDCDDFFLLRGQEAILSLRKIINYELI